MKELRFDTERKRDTERDQIELPINGDVYFAYRPSTNSTALFYASAGKRNIAIALAGVQEFLEKVLEPEAFVLIMDAVAKDALDYEELLDLCKAIISEFAEAPPTSSTASSTSPGSAGRSSTANSRRPASTRASTRSRASAD